MASLTEPTLSTVEQILAAAEREPGPSRSEQIAQMTAAERRRGFAAKLRVFGASRSEVRRALRPLTHGARHRRAPGARPVRRSGSRRSSQASRDGPSEPADEPPGLDVPPRSALAEAWR